MTPEQKEAIRTLQTVINAAVSKGIFGDTTSVVAVHNALSVVVDGLGNGSDPKNNKATVTD